MFYEEPLPLGAKPKYNLAEDSVVLFLNKEKQLIKVGPGLKEFTCPLFTNLSRDEAQQTAKLIQKEMPGNSSIIHVIDGGPQVGRGVMGVTSKDVLELSERIYVCEKCGLIMDRDQNAAINIKYAASIFVPPGADGGAKTPEIHAFSCG